MNGSSAITVTGAAKSFGALAVLRDVDLRVAPGSIVALLGPSGCGKTTLLRSIAGLERLAGGEVRIGDRTVSGPGVHVPPERRRVGMVFQARALAPTPGVLLLDEPFSNLDTSLRVQVRTEVHQLLASLGVTTVFVTHDQEEAFVLGDEVAVMHGGRIVQQANPAELYARPATSWVATFVGDANLVGGTAAGASAATPVGPVALERPLAGDVDVVLRPEELRLVPLADEAGAPATVELCEFYGHDT